LVFDPSFEYQVNNKAALRGLKIIAVGVRDKDVVSWVVIG